MKTLICTVVFFVFALFGSFGQSIDKDYVDNWILKTFPNSRIDENVIYILNGVPIGNDTINAGLSKYKQGDLTTINFIDKPTIDSLIFCRPSNGIILMISKGQQTQKSIKSDLKVVKEKFIKSKIRTTADIDPKNEDPVLIIDGKQIFFRDCSNEINKLDSKELVGINIIDKPVSKDIYGTNAVNGLIIITKK